MGKMLTQAGVIPYRIADGKVEVLLVTSRDTGRWVIPKGHVEQGMTPQSAACQEAWEEAGVTGEITTRMPLGFVPYLKRLKDGNTCGASIAVFPLLVEKQKNKWQERSERTRTWFSIEKAAELVDEPALSALLLRLDEILSS
ncbi:MAG TPA: NUDIX hydrolase [Magnetospirillaceae bacterium]|nr:NUDIX hydrolase [Magnetospirillaceae bacterium]